MKKVDLLLLVVIFVVMATYQNCSKVDFTPAEAGLAKTDTGGNQNFDNEDEINNDQEVTGTGDGDGGGEVQPVPSNLSDSANGSFICILEGPGKSTKVGYRDEVLAAQNKTPKVVCMSEYACRELISRKFSVKSVGQRGFCPKRNPHVVPLSDAAIAELVK